MGYGGVYELAHDDGQRVELPTDGFVAAVSFPQYGHMKGTDKKKAEARCSIC